MARRIDQIQLVELTVIRAIVEAHGLRLDGNTALTLDIHGIEHLLLHLPRREPAAELDQTICQSGLAVIDMGDDGEVADVGKRRNFGVTHAALGTEHGAQGQARHAQKIRRNGGRIRLIVVAVRF